MRFSLAVLVIAMCAGCQQNAGFNKYPFDVGSSKADVMLSGVTRDRIGDVQVTALGEVWTLTYFFNHSSNPTITFDNHGRVTGWHDPCQSLNTRRIPVQAHS